MSVCRSCGAPVVWAVTINGKRMPVDPLPVPDGNITLEGDPWAPTAVVLPSGDPLMTETARYVSHYVTCPDAESWRHPR